MRRAHPKMSQLHLGTPFLTNSQKCLPALFFRIFNHLVKLLFHIEYTHRHSQWDSNPEKKEGREPSRPSVIRRARGYPFGIAKPCLEAETGGVTRRVWATPRSFVRYLPLWTGRTKRPRQCKYKWKEKGKCSRTGRTDCPRSRLRPAVRCLRKENCTPPAKLPESGVDSQ